MINPLVVLSYLLKSVSTGSEGISFEVINLLTVLSYLLKSVSTSNTTSLKASVKTWFPFDTLIKESVAGVIDFFVSSLL